MGHVTLTVIHKLLLAMISLANFVTVFLYRKLLIFVRFVLLSTLVILVTYIHNV